MSSFTSYTFRAAPWDPNKIVVHATGDPVDAPPLYSVSASKEGTPKVVVFYSWGATPADVIGDAKFSNSVFSSTSYLTLRGQPMEMKESLLGGDFRLDRTPMGPMKWRTDLLSSSRMNLRDRFGKKLAKVEKARREGEKTLHLISDDPYLLELVLLMYFTALTLNKTFFETCDDIAGGILGI